MKLRNLGKSGLRVSLVGLGCNNFGSKLDVEGTRKVVHKALDLGITLFDTADVYGYGAGYGLGSETCLGQVLGERRKDIVLATKFGHPMGAGDMMKGASRRYIVTAVEASLRRLQTDWIDLYQQHTTDASTPIDETLRALEDLTRAGKIRYVGCSNFKAWQVADAQWTARTAGAAGFVSCQDEYSLLVRDLERDLQPAAAAFGMGILPYFPLASGLLTGKYRRNQALPENTRLAVVKRLADRYMTEANWAIVEQLADFCESRGHSMLELAFSWLAARAQVSSVIAGATTPEQVEQNVKAVDWTLGAEDLAEIDRITRGA